MRRQSALSSRMTMEHLLRVFVDLSDMLFKTDLILTHSGKEKKWLWLMTWCRHKSVMYSNSPPRWFEAKKKMLHL